VKASFVCPACRATVAAPASLQGEAYPCPKCRAADGGFGHYPGSPSDADACFFHVGTLVMAGWLKPADPLPKDSHLLGWGHLFPIK